MMLCAPSSSYSGVNLFIQAPESCHRVTVIPSSTGSLRFNCYEKSHNYAKEEIEHVEMEIPEEKETEIPMFDSEQLDREYFESQVEEKEEIKWENSLSEMNIHG